MGVYEDNSMTTFKGKLSTSTLYVNASDRSLKVTVKRIISVNIRVTLSHRLHPCYGMWTLIK